jgi:hypothetical protein
MKKLLVISIICLILYSMIAIAGPSHKIVVAVVDTGLDPELMNDSSICPDGHKDFTGQGLQDINGHGTHISYLIDQYAKNFILLKDGDSSKLKSIKSNYCQIILKYYW